MNKYEGIQEVKEVSKVDDVNKLLSEDWLILDIHTIPSQTHQYVTAAKTVYIMGKR